MKCKIERKEYFWNLLHFRKSSKFQTILLWWMISIFWKRSIFWNVFSRNWKFPILSVGFLLVSAVDYQNFYNSSIKNRVVWQGYFFLQINCNEKDMVLFNWDIFGRYKTCLLFQSDRGGHEKAADSLKCKFNLCLAQ